MGSTIQYNLQSELDMLEHVMHVFSGNFGGMSGIHDRSAIFVVGMPRSGSTLVEQILASHSKVRTYMRLIICSYASTLSSR